MANLTWTSKGLRCLHDIYEYFAVDNHHAAASVVRGSCEKAELRSASTRIVVKGMNGLSTVTCLRRGTGITGLRTSSPTGLESWCSGCFTVAWRSIAT